MTLQELDSIGFLLGSTYRRVSNLFAAKLKEYDITPEQWGVLYYICAQEGMNQKELAAHAYKDQPTTARILDVLHRKGLIRKEIDPHDRRAFLVYPNEDGRALMQKVHALEAQHNQEIAELITPEHMEQLSQLLHELRSRLEEA
ncbi:MarR family winged helix-turn-helix transcriptional regulator [Paenibacillus hunanensis]|uniref:DNA-binding MarR family transcriptional regulator n=1 Tax=Paenibacillus hunanensis TaxID=539262 RepID=A0ABU1J0X3_9BACL|nr:MarR family winged helix-turn-helix transcriptional regulator [Paenibacillus hunanensis]MCL9663396.1 MarR family winged helix-turn-helix transcriptional regulator [Paenibacillus hunanensis]MDR6245155.1 DNA-binding MarR family transcriptional regulator [Paenibacillus hunanensis]GGJ21024.1 transcriptional regulator [Paenibacillus hunanensis]